MNLKSFLVATCAFALFASNAVAQSTSKYSDPSNWKWEKGTIVTQTPARAAGQKSVLNLATPRLQTVRVAFVGLGIGICFCGGHCARPIAFALHRFG